MIRSSRTTSRHRPPARGTGFGPHNAASGALRQNRVHPAVFTRAPRRRKSVVQSDFAVPDSLKSCKASGTNGVRLGFSGGIAKSGQFVGGRAHRGLDFVQPLRVAQHRELAVEARRPCRKLGESTVRLAIGTRHSLPSYVTRRQQSLATRNQQLGSLVVAVGQLVVDLFHCVQGPVVEVGGAFVGESCHRLVRARRQ